MKLNFLFYLCPAKKTNKEKNMLVVKVKEGENIDKALKRFKKKFEKAGILREIRERQFYKKPSERRREIVRRAIFIQKLREKS